MQQVQFVTQQVQFVTQQVQFVIPDLIRDPVSHHHWIAGQARNDNKWHSLPPLCERSGRWGAQP